MASAPPKDLSIPGGRRPLAHEHLQLLLLLVMLVVGGGGAESYCDETGMQNNTGSSSLVADADFDDGNEFLVSLSAGNDA